MRKPLFKDRKDAGRQVGEALLPYYEKDIVVLAIPKGGVEIAYYAARILECGFHIVVSRKLRHPGQPELAFGAIAEDKSLYLNPSIRARLSKPAIEQAINGEEKEILRQIAKYRNGQPLPSMQTKTVAIVDDGIATGSTLLVTIKLCRKKGAGRIIVAAPVSSPEMYRKLKSTVDDVVILETPHNFYAVSNAYRRFENLEDKDVVALIKSSHRQKDGKNPLLQ